VQRFPLLVLATAFLVPLASGPASSGDPANQHRAEKPAMTTVTLSFKNCPECTVRPERFVQSQSPKGRTWPIRRVGADLTVSYRVPTRLTPGMSFFVEAPWHGGDGSASVLAVRYAGREVGTRMTSRMARPGRRASGCWAGTTERTATIPVRVDRFRTRTFGQGRTWHPRAFATRATASTPPMMGPLWKGALGAQDSIDCKVPKDEGPSTTVTYTVADCEGCLVLVYQWPAGTTEPPYISEEKAVVGGQVRFVVPTRRTHGMEVSVQALRDGKPVSIALALTRYRDYGPGDEVTLDQAASQAVGSPCWVGTNAPAVTLALSVRQVDVFTSALGTHPGTIAWLSPQLESLGPMVTLRDGVYTSEELTQCELP